MLKRQGCPHCGAAGTLNRHSRLFGHDPVAVAGRLLRGQRVFCSSRGVRGGCGATYSLVLAGVVPRHIITAPLLWQLLVGLLAGQSLKATAETLAGGFSLEAFYRIRRGLRRRLDALRVALCRVRSPPPSPHVDPLLQTVAHLRAAFAHDPCPPSAFQLQLQRPILG